MPYTIEAGLNKNLEPVIKCSVKMYDKIIQEAKDFINEEYNRINTKYDEKETTQILARKYPALVILSQNPKYGEIQKRN